MKVFNTENINYNDFKHEITQGSGVIVIKDVYSKDPDGTLWKLSKLKF